MAGRREMPACRRCPGRALRRLFPRPPLHRRLNPVSTRKFESVGKAVFVIWLASFAASADAHSTVKGVGDLYAGLLHVLTTLEHVLPFIALSLLAEQRGLKAQAQAVVLVF